MRGVESGFSRNQGVTDGSPVGIRHALWQKFAQSRVETLSVPAVNVRVYGEPSFDPTVSRE